MPGLRALAAALLFLAVATWGGRRGGGRLVTKAKGSFSFMSGNRAGGGEETRAETMLGEATMGATVTPLVLLDEDSTRECAPERRLISSLLHQQSQSARVESQYETAEHSIQLHHLQNEAIARQLGVSVDKDMTVDKQGIKSLLAPRGPTGAHVESLGGGLDDAKTFSSSEDISKLRKKCNLIVNRLELMEENEQLLKTVASKSDAAALEAKVAKLEKENAAMKLQLKRCGVNATTVVAKDGTVPALNDNSDKAEDTDLEVEKSFCPDPLPGWDYNSMEGYDPNSKCVQWRDVLHNVGGSEDFVKAEIDGVDGDWAFWLDKDGKTHWVKSWKEYEDAKEQREAKGQQNPNGRCSKLCVRMLKKYNGTWMARKIAGWATDLMRMVYTDRPHVEPWRAAKAANDVAEDWARARGLKWCMRVASESEGCPPPVGYINGTKVVGWEHAKVCTAANGRTVELSVPWDGGPGNENEDFVPSKCNSESVKKGNAELWDSYPYTLTTSAVGRVRRVHCRPGDKEFKTFGLDKTKVAQDMNQQWTAISELKCSDPKCAMHSQQLPCKDKKNCRPRSLFEHGANAAAGFFRAPYGLEVNRVEYGSNGVSPNMMQKNLHCCQDKKDKTGKKVGRELYMRKHEVTNRTKLWENYQEMGNKGPIEGSFTPRPSYLTTWVNMFAVNGFFGMNDTRGDPAYKNRLIPQGFLERNLFKPRPDSKSEDPGDGQSKGFETSYAIASRLGLHAIALGTDADGTIMRKSSNLEGDDIKPGLMCATWVSVCGTTQGKYFREKNDPFGKKQCDEKGKCKQSPRKKYFGDSYYPTTCETSREVHGCFSNKGTWRTSCDFVNDLGSGNFASVAQPMAKVFA